MPHVHPFLAALLYTPFNRRCSCVSLHFCIILSLTPVTIPLGYFYLPSSWVLKASSQVRYVAMIYIPDLQCVPLLC